MMEDFWSWLPKAYGEVGDDPVFTKYNMEVAFAAGAENEAKRFQDYDTALLRQALEAMDDMATDSRLLDMSATRIHIFETARDAIRAALEQTVEQDKMAIMQRIVDSNTGFIRTKHNIGVE